MTAKKSILLNVFIVLFSIMGHCQERISIKDPELSFSYNLPKGATNQDDPFYHYIMLPATTGKAVPVIQLTYFESYNISLHDYMDGVLNAKLASSLADFKKVSNGSDSIDANKAEWAKYSFTEKGIEKCGILYVFERYSQYFEVIATSDCADFAAHEADFRKVVRSLEIVKN